MMCENKRNRQMRKQHTSPIPMVITCGVKPMPADPESVSPTKRKNTFIYISEAAENWKPIALIFFQFG